MGLLKLPSWCLLTLIVTANVLPAASLCFLDTKYTIRSQSTGYALDSTSDRITLQFYSGNYPQRWCLEYTSTPSILNIVSVDPLGRALDGDVIGADHGVHLDDRHYTSDTQQWILNSDGTIANIGAGGHLCLNGYGGKIEVGNTLQLTSCDQEVEKWVLQEL